MKRLALSMWLLLLSAQPAPARTELVFKVPEVRHAVVSRPVGAGPSRNTSRANDTDNPLIQATTEHYLEHEISTSDARKAAELIKLFQVPETLPGCGKCSRWEVEYCASGVVGDHCCCERRYMPEPFPWLPHACLLRAERCTPRAQNCARYTRIRDCCCNRKLAEQWKAILSSASVLSVSSLILLLFALVLVTLYL